MTSIYVLLIYFSVSDKQRLNLLQNVQGTNCQGDELSRLCRYRKNH